MQLGPDPDRKVSPMDKRHSGKVTNPVRMLKDRRVCPVQPYPNPDQAH
jgi:hypothetical protein